jgi:hypothetical protein
MQDAGESDSEGGEFAQDQNSIENFAANQLPTGGAGREETPGPRRRIVAMEARVTPDSYNSYPESALMFWGSCVNEDTRGSGAFNVRFEVDGSPYGPDIPVGSLDPGAYTEVSLQVMPGTLAPGQHIMAVICNTDFVIEKPNAYSNKIGAYGFTVSEPGES